MSTAQPAAGETDRRVDTRYPVLPALVDRWSPRSFTDREPEPAKLCSMFEAARLAPSAHNTQPTRFLLARKGRGDVYRRLFDCLDDHNQEWADRAPVLILASVTRRRFSQITGEFHPYPHCLHDLGLAVMSLTVQAHHLGLHTHLMAAFDPEKAQEEFAIPELFLPAMVIAVGYLGPSDALPPDLREKEEAPRTRRPLEELVFEDGWGEASALFGSAETA
ncbi:MAG: nitroreductase family protein [Sphingomonadaceae bacterium]